MFKKIALLTVIFPSIIYSAIDNCDFDQITIDKKHLSCINNHLLLKNAVSSIKEYKVMAKKCPDCREQFINAKKYAHLFQKEIIGMGISVHGFGGYYLYVMFRKESFLYKFWLYNLDGNHFQLREISKEGKLVSIFKNGLKNDVLGKYWIKL